MEPTLLLSDSEILGKKLDAFTFDTAKALFEIHGFLKIQNLFPKPWVESLAQAFSERISFDPETLRMSRGAKVQRGRYIVQIPFSPPFSDSRLFADPILLSLMKAFLGEDCILGGLGAVVALPGAQEQHIHSDFEPLFKEQPFLTAVHAPFAIAVGIPLIDIDPVNGPTKIWSATHRAPEVDKGKIDERFERHLLHGPAGSCYFWDYRTYHAGGSNHSDSPRPLLYLSYTRRWFRDLKNPDKVVMDHEEIAPEHKSLFPRPEYLATPSEEEFQSKVLKLFEGKE